MSMCVRFWVTQPEEVDDNEEEDEEEVDEEEVDDNNDKEEEEGDNDRLTDIPPIDDLSIPGGAWLDVCFCLYETDI